MITHPIRAIQRHTPRTPTDFRSIARDGLLWLTICAMFTWFALAIFTS